LRDLRIGVSFGLVGAGGGLDTTQGRDEKLGAR
jgi:hypothetical protein